MTDRPAALERWCGRCRLCHGSGVVPDCSTVITARVVTCPKCGGMGCILAGFPNHRHAVLRVLHHTGRFSVFEAMDNMDIARTMTDLKLRGLIEVDTSPGFPWSNVKLTDAGLAMLAGGKPDAR